MPEVELVLKANNSQYVSSVKEAQKVTQDLNDTNETGNKRRMGFIEQEEKRIKSLTELRRKSYTNTNIEYYNKQIDEGRKRLHDYEQLGTKAVKTTDSLSSSIGKWALTLGGATLILKKLLDAFKDTVAGMTLFNQVGAVTRQVMNDIVTGAGISIARIQEVIKAQTILNELRLEESFESVKVAKINAEYQKLYTASIDQTLSRADQLKNIDAALAKHNELISIQIEHTKKEIVSLRAQMDASPTNIKLIERWNAARAKEQNLEAERDASTKRLNSRRSGILKDQEDEQNKIKQDALKTWEDAIEKGYQDQIKMQKEYQDVSLQLLDRYEKSQIDMLKGQAKLEAIRDFGLKEIKELKDQLAKLGSITAEQDKMFEAMGVNVMKSFYEGMAKEISVSDEHIGKMVTPAIISTLAGDADIIRKDVEAERKKIAATIAANEAMEPFSVWKLLGIDEDSDEGERQIAAIKEVANTITNILKESLDQRVEIAQRERELLDTQISQLQNEIELEANLMEEGYANNLDAKKKELEGLKKQREQALKEEEAALKRQQAFERISQAVSLASSVANLLKEFTKLGPLGLGLAAVAIGSLFAIWSAAKAKAAAGTKLAEGGSGTETGMITGKRHSEGGERFLDHVEVERGEAFGVLSRQATGKYGNIFHEMVSSFNKNEMPSFVAPAVTNSVRVDNNGPNSRLDKVIKEQRRLNESIMNQSQIYNTGNKRVIKRGNKIRIVG